MPAAQDPDRALQLAARSLFRMLDRAAMGSMLVDREYRIA